MADTFDDLLKRLEALVQTLKKEHGISIEPLEQTIEELKQHAGHVSALEDRIASVRAEVIAPVKDELVANKRAGKFSIYGLYVGAVALALTVITSVIPLGAQLIARLRGSPSEATAVTEGPLPAGEADTVLQGIRRDVSLLVANTIGLVGTYAPAGTELELRWGADPAPLVASDTETVSGEVWLIREEESEDTYSPVVYLTVLLGERALGGAGLSKFVQLVNNSGLAHYDSGHIVLSEGDQFVLMDVHAFSVKRIFRRESQSLVVADDRNSVLLGYVQK